MLTKNKPLEVVLSSVVDTDRCLVSLEVNTWFISFVYGIA